MFKPHTGTAAPWSNTTLNTHILRRKNSLLCFLLRSLFCFLTIKYRQTSLVMLVNNGKPCHGRFYSGNTFAVFCSTPTFTARLANPGHHIIILGRQQASNTIALTSSSMPHRGHSNRANKIYKILNLTQPTVKRIIWSLTQPGVIA